MCCAGRFCAQQPWLEVGRAHAHMAHPRTPLFVARLRMLVLRAHARLPRRAHACLRLGPPCTQMLSVCRCTRLSDAALASIATCGALQHLAVSCVHEFGPCSMAALAASCHDTLETLDISFCRWVLLRASCASQRAASVAAWQRTAGAHAHVRAYKRAQGCDGQRAWLPGRQLRQAAARAGLWVHAGALQM